MKNILIADEKIKKISYPIKIDNEYIIGNSEEIQKIYKIAKHVADKDVAILIEGETGTGKELITRLIHANSKRKNNLFIPINCGALSESLLESELFGYEKGAFTGAQNIKYGILETANNGTIFLDDINSASPNVQARLLRFLETGEFFRVGGNKLIKCCPRIIAASNQNIENLAAEKKFREDLYYRLNIIKIELPPLRKRKEDIIPLTNFFLEMYNKKFMKKVKMNKSTKRYLFHYSWPGNVRELKNLIHSLVLLNETGYIMPENLPKGIKKENIFSYNHLSFKELKKRVIINFELKYLKNILEITRGNVSQAAKIAKLTRRNFTDKFKSYNINPSIYKPTF